MFCSKLLGHKETTFYASAVYYLVTLLLSLWTLSPQAQMLKLDDIAQSQYEGNSETFGMRPCQMRASELKKNFVGRLVQNLELVTSSKGKKQSRSVFQWKPLTRDKAPLTCNKKSKTCLWEFTVAKIATTQKSRQQKSEFYSLSLESSLKAPTDFRLISLYKSGSASGARRIQWDCVISRKKKAEPLSPEALLNY